MYDHTQKQFFQFLPPLTHLTNFLNRTTTYKKTTKNVFSKVTSKKKKNLCGQATARKENSYMYDHSKKLVFKVLRPSTKLTKISILQTSCKKNTKSDCSTSQRLKTNLCTLKEHSCVYEHTQEQFLKISQPLTQLT